ncbi:oxidoreductase CipA-like protein [Colletotrichum zoysiae]|uniref:Oxidoreductase CipA-like protein n=1 Tax=Colletotrichum zoysiae TaxID=1216348 RepID=A0AAD9M7M8_9PEZI|nr:oxidoreductase CipA-like protein [Colletotrichum zoysiae]
MSSTRIALAGATGNLGIPLLKALLDADFFVTVLSRKGGNAAKLPSHPNLDVKKVDLQSVESLRPALSGVEVVVSCVASAAIGSQNPLIDASVAAGVKRFVPAEFGMDSRNRLCAQLPVVCAPKVATQKYLVQQSEARPGFTFTAIANGLFLDWGLEMGVILDLGRRSATLYNGGDVPFSATTLSDVVAAVLGVIRHQPQTANRVVYVHSALVTQNQLIQYAKEFDRKEWSTSVKDTEELRRESLVELAKGALADVDGAMLGLCICGAMSSDYGCDFSERLDNELLGIEKMDETRLRAVVASFLG